jgi:hypothetical protein
VALCGFRSLLEEALDNHPVFGRQPRSDRLELADERSPSVHHLGVDYRREPHHGASPVVRVDVPCHMAAVLEAMDQRRRAAR